MDVKKPVMIPVAKLRCNPDNPKKPMGRKETAGLRELLAKHGFAGVLQVALDPGDVYMVMDGNTRLEEIQAADVTEVPCNIHASLAYTEANHITLRKEFAISFDAHRKIFDKQAVIKELKDMVLSGGDVKKLALVSGIDKLARIVEEDVSKKLPEAIAAHTARSAPMESLVLYGTAEEINAIRTLLTGIKGKFTASMKVKTLLEHAHTHLDVTGESFLTVFLATLVRYQELVLAGKPP